MKIRELKDLYSTLKYAVGDWSNKREVGRLNEVTEHNPVLDGILSHEQIKEVEVEPFVYDPEVAKKSAEYFRHNLEQIH